MLFFHKVLYKTIFVKKSRKFESFCVDDLAFSFSLLRQLLSPEELFRRAVKIVEMSASLCQYKYEK